MNVQMHKDKLIDILLKNRTEHVALYNEAVGAYGARVKDTIVDLAAKFGATGDLDLGPLSRLRNPESYESQYTEAIEMLNHTQENNITLTQAEFRQYVLDKWSWVNSFSTSNSAYLSPESTAKLSSKF